MMKKYFFELKQILEGTTFHWYHWFCVTFTNKNSTSSYIFGLTFCPISGFLSQCVTVTFQINTRLSEIKIIKKSLSKKWFKHHFKIFKQLFYCFFFNPSLRSAAKNRNVEKTTKMMKIYRKTQVQRAEFHKLELGKVVKQKDPKNILFTVSVA